MLSLRWSETMSCGTELLTDPLFNPQMTWDVQSPQLPFLLL
jgi:hypothetical protein